MKKTYTINLSGKIFHIDEDALEKLQEYINTLKTYYTQEEDGNEIMDDIENRIGELFTENLKGQFREVITLDDVDQAIATKTSSPGNPPRNRPKNYTVTRITKYLVEWPGD